MSTGGAVLNVLFIGFALAAMAGALFVAVSRNIVRSAFSLLMVLFSVAALYALSKVDFIFAVQVLVYVGGILVLIIFAVMLTHKIVDVNVSNESAPTPWAAAATLCLLIILVLVIAVMSQRWYLATEVPRIPADAPWTEKVGEALMTRYLYPFEIVSVLLLACLIGAAYLARKEVKP
jgi:NADH-quinone oxidoreductase subunit J